MGNTTHQKAAEYAASIAEELSSESIHSLIIISFIDIELAKLPKKERQSCFKKLEQVQNDIINNYSSEKLQASKESNIMGLHWCDDKDAMITTLTQIYSNLIIANKHDGYDWGITSGNTGHLILWIDP